MGDSFGDVNIMASLRVGRPLGDVMGDWSFTAVAAKVGEGKYPGIFFASMLLTSCVLFAVREANRGSFFGKVGVAKGVENLLLVSLCPDAWPKLPAGL